MAIKFYCDIEGFRDNWVELTDRWTQSEAKEAEIAMGKGWDAYLEMLKKKVTGCEIHIPAGAAITDFDEIREATLDALDLQMGGFIGGLLQHTISRLRALGNASVRVSSSKLAGQS